MVLAEDMCRGGKIWKQKLEREEGSASVEEKENLDLMIQWNFFKLLNTLIQLNIDWVKYIIILLFIIQLETPNNMFTLPWLIEILITWHGLPY